MLNERLRQNTFKPSQAGGGLNGFAGQNTKKKQHEATTTVLHQQRLETMHFTPRVGFGGSIAHRRRTRRASVPTAGASVPTKFSIPMATRDLAG